METQSVDPVETHEAAIFFISCAARYLSDIAEQSSCAASRAVVVLFSAAASYKCNHCRCVILPGSQLFASTAHSQNFLRFFCEARTTSNMTSSTAPPASAASQKPGSSSSTTTATAAPPKPAKQSSAQDVATKAAESTGFYAPSPSPSRRPGPVLPSFGSWQMTPP